MSKAISTSTTSRRGLLAASGAGAILAGIGARPSAAEQVVQIAPLTAHPDAATLAACTAFMEAHFVYEAVELPGNDIPDEEQDRLHEVWHEKLDVVTEMRAKTPDGMRAKARVMIAAFDMDLNRSIGETVEDRAEPHELLAWRLAHDILLGVPA